MATPEVLNQQQLGRHRGTTMKPARRVSKSGKTTGYADVLPSRRTDVHDAYEPKHSKTGWRQDTMPDRGHH